MEMGTDCSDGHGEDGGDLLVGALFLMIEDEDVSFDGSEEGEVGVDSEGELGGSGEARLRRGRGEGGDLPRWIRLETLKRRMGRRVRRGGGLHGGGVSTRPERR